MVYRLKSPRKMTSYGEDTILYILNRFIEIQIVSRWRSVNRGEHKFSTPSPSRKTLTVTAAISDLLLKEIH